MVVTGAVLQLCYLVDQCTPDHYGIGDSGDARSTFAVPYAKSHSKRQAGVLTQTSKIAYDRVHIQMRSASDSLQRDVINITAAHFANRFSAPGARSRRNKENGFKLVFTQN